MSLHPAEIEPSTKAEKLAFLAKQKQLLSETGAYSCDPEVVFTIADTLAGSPEEFTELTGKKLGMQPLYEEDTKSDGRIR